ncbi:MAG: arginine--tRNA ligase [Candidatus Pacebacteria bacterium]|nr:arginine--tRNA ligase [Candidatus Paceibacterota bacterium]
MQEKIKNLIKDALKTLDISEVDFVVEHPEDFKNGDYYTNVAMAGAKHLKTNPKELAQKVLEEMNKNLPKEIEKIEVAGAGFINFHLSPKFFHGSIEEILNNKNFGENKSLKNKKIMIEHTVPNPFKPFHIGHLMTNAIGESIGRILAYSGAQVSQNNYQGDVGLHVAKAIWGLMKDIKLQETLDSIDIQARNIGLAYVDGSDAYETNENAKAEIDEINKKIYSRESEKINEIYDWGFKVTMEAFEGLYKILGTKFEYYFLESNMAPIGKEIVEDNTGNVFEESDGAVVFKAEKYDPKLHTRVFITKAGLPTYETKELGLTVEKFKTLPDINIAIVVTANEQLDYMRVVAKAISLIYPEYTDKMKHITHGMMRLLTGKMSSRKGNIVTGESLIHDTIDLVREKISDREWEESKKKEISEKVGVAAIKYSILKQATGGDIAFDFETSISFEGDSGPYLQYSHARAKSVLEKAAAENILPDPHSDSSDVFEVEKLLYRFPEVVERAADEYEPHYIANYLIEVARSFNSFYGNNVIVAKEDKTSAYKVALTFAFAFVMKRGLNLLGIEAPEKM